MKSKLLLKSFKTSHMPTPKITGTTVALESNIQRSPDWPRVQKEHLLKLMDKTYPI